MTKILIALLVLAVARLLLYIFAPKQDSKSDDESESDTKAEDAIPKKQRKNRDNHEQ